MTKFLKELFRETFIKPAKDPWHWLGFILILAFLLAIRGFIKSLN
jgi:hypothetical protein